MHTTLGAHPPRRLLAWVIALRCALALGAQTTVTYTPTFTATGVNMWGNSSTFSNNTYTFGASWNESGSSGGIDSSWLGDWGARVYGSTSGAVGININVFSNAGHVDVALPYTVTISSATDLSSAGAHSLNVQHALLAPSPGASYMASTFASAGFDITAKLRLQASVGFEAAIYKRFGGSVEVIDTDLTIPVASFSENTLSLLGTPIADFTSGYTHELKSPSGPLGVTFPWQKRIGTITVEAPNLDGTSGSTLSITAEQQRLLGLGIDIVGLAAAKANLPVNPLDMRLSVAGAGGVELLLLKTAFGVNFGLKQELDLTPTLGVVLRSSSPLTYLKPDGSTETTTRFVVTNLAQPISFTKPAGDVSIFPEFFVTTTLQNQLGLLVNGFATVEALKAKFSLRGLGSITFGPLLSGTDTTPSLYNILYSNHGTISGTTLSDTYIGGSITTVAPTIGDLDATQRVDVPGLIGVFNTSAIAGSLRLSDGGLYSNQVHLTLAPTGSLVLANGAGANANQFSTPSLTNTGYIQVGQGASLAAGTFTNVAANGELSGGTLEVHGAMTYTGPSIVTNNANLTVTGSLQNRATTHATFGNALTTLAANRPGAALRLGVDLNTGRAFSNQGTMVLDRTLTTTTFHNSADATLAVNGNASLRITDANGLLNVNLTSGQLLDGTYLLAGSIYYQGANGDAGRTITSLGPNTTLVLDGFSADPRISHWQPDGSMNRDALATLAANHGNFALANGARQTLTQGFDNHGSLWIDGPETELLVQGNFTNQSGRTLHVDAGTLALQGDVFDHYFANFGTLNLTADGRIEVDGMLGNFSNVDLDARTATLSGGTWNVGGTIAYGTGETAAPNIREIGANTTLNLLGGSFYNQFHNQDALSYLAINRGSLFLQSQVLKSVAPLTNHSTGLITVTGASGWLGFRHTLANTGTIIIGAGSTLSSLGTLTYADAGNWTNVAPDGTLSSIGNLVLAGTLEYKGTPITALGASNTLTLAGDSWRFSRRTGSNTSSDGLALSSIAGSLILANGAIYTAPHSQTFALHSTGNLTLTDDSGLIASPGATLLAQSGATITNDGVILLQHGGSSGAQLGAVGTLTLAGTGSVQLTDSAANRLIDSGGTIINAATHTILGAGELSANLVNRGLIESFGPSGLLLKPNAGATLTNSGVIRSNGSFTYPLINGDYDFEQPTFAPSLLTLRDLTLANFEGTTPGTISSHSTMLIAHATIAGGSVEVATGGALTLDDATLALDEFEVGPIGNLTIAPGHTRIATTADASSGLGSTLTLQDSGNVNVPTRLELHGATTFTQAGTIILENGAVIDGTGTLVNNGAIRHVVSGATATLGANVRNGANGVIEIDNTATLRFAGPLTNAGDIFIGASGETAAGTIAFTGNSSLTGGGAIQLGGRVSTTVDDVTTHSWAGSGRLTAASGATVTLTNINNTISGAGTIDGMTIVNATGGTLRATASGATLLVQPSSGGFTNAGLLAVDADARLEIDPTDGAFTNYANHTLTGGRYDIAGTLAIAGADIRTNAAEITVRSGGQFINATNGANVFASLETNAANGVLRLANGSIATADLFANHGTLEIGEAGDTAASNLTVGRLTGAGSISLNHSASTLTLGGASGSATYSGVFSGSGALVKSGAATQTLAAENTFTGGTLLSGGTFALGHNAALGTGPLTLAGGILTGDGFARTLANPVALSTDSTIGGNSALNFMGTLTNTPPTGTPVLAVTNSAATTFASIVLDPTSTGRSLAIANTGDVTVAQITGTQGTFIKQGSGTLTLSGANTQGSTRLEAGTLVLGHNNALAGRDLVLRGGTVERNASSGGGYHNLILEGDATIGGSLPISFLRLTNSGGNHTLSVTNSASTILTTAVALSNDATNRTLTINNSGNVFIMGSIANGGTSTASSLVKSGTGELLLFSGANPFSGGLTVQQGAVAFNTLADLGTGAVILDGGGLRWISDQADVSHRLAPLGAGGGTFNLDQTVHFATGLTGAGGISLLGIGDLNLHAGSTQVLGGTLRIKNHDLLPDGTVLTIATGAFFDLSVSNETLGALAGSGNVHLDGSTLTLAGDTTTLFSGQLLGQGALRKTGTGVQTLGGTSSFNGPVEVAGGTLRLGTDQALATTTALTLANDGRVDLDGHHVTVAALHGSSATAIELGDGTLTTGGNHESTTFAGQISGSGNLIKTGTGTLMLTGENTFSGGVTVNEGFLGVAPLTDFGTGIVTLDGGGLLWAPGTTTDITSRLIALGASGGTFDTNGNNLAFATAISGPGALTKTGAGTLTFLTANPYGGGTVLDAGTLRITADAQLGAANAPVTFTGGALQLGATLTLGRALTLSNGTGTLDTDSHDVTLSGALTGSGALLKTGTGTLTLTAANTHSGGTTLATGTLQLGQSGALGSGRLTLGGGTLLATGTFANAITLAGSSRIRTEGNLTLTGSLSGDAEHTLTKIGSGELRLATPNSYAGSTILNEGTLIAAATNAFGSGTLVFAGGTLDAVASQTLANPIQLDAHAHIAGTADELTLFGGISGAASVTKSGPGALALAGNSIYTGGTTLTGGTLFLNHDHALGSGTLTLVAGTIASRGTRTITNPVDLRTLGHFAPENTLTLSGTITSGEGGTGLRKSGAGTLALAGSNTYSGVTRLEGGTLAANHDQAFGTSTLVLAGGTLDVGNLSRTLANAVQLETSSTVTGHADLTFLGLLAVSGAGNRTLSISNTGSTTFGGGLQLTAGNAFVLDAAQDVAVTGFITDGGPAFAGGFTKTGAGQLTLTAANPYAGATTLSAGTLVAGHDSALGTGTLRLNGGTLRTEVTAHSLDNAISLQADSTVQTESDLTLTGLISGHAGFDLTKTGAGTLRIVGENTYEGNTTLNAGTLVIASNTALGSGSLVLIGGSLELDGVVTSLANPLILGTDFAFGPAHDLTLNGAISGSGYSLAKTGTGTLTLNGAGTYTGGTSVEAGTLALGGHERLADTGPLAVNGGTVNLGNFTETTGAFTLNSGTLTGTGKLFAPSFEVGAGIISADLSGAGTLTKTTTGTVTLTGYSSYTGGTRLAAGTLAMAGDYLGATTGTLTFAGGSLRLTGSISTIRGIHLESDGVIDTNGYEASLFSPISGPGGFTKTGAGTLRLWSANTYTGGTTITAGVLELGWHDYAASVLGPILNHGTILIDRTDDMTLANLITGSGVLTKNGTNTLILTANNGFTGTTTVAAGTLAVGAGGTSGALAGDIANHGALIFNRSDALTYGGTISGTGSFEKKGEATLVLTGPTALAGPATITAGTLQIGTGGDIAWASGEITNGGALVFNHSNTIALPGSIAGTGTLTKQGSGALTLGAANSFTGATTVSGGILTLGHQQALQNSIVTLDGGTLGFSTITQATFVGLRGSAPLALTNNASAAVALTLTGASDSSYSGTLSGNGSLTKNGLGTLTLSGANTFTGSTTLNAGTIAVTDRDALGRGPVAVAFHATVSVQGPAATIGGLTGLGDVQLGSDSADRTKVLTLAPTGDATFLGAINGYGTVVIDGTGSQKLRNVAAFSGPLILKGGTFVAELESALGADYTAPVIFDGGTLRTQYTIGMYSRSNWQLAAGGGTFSPDAGTTLLMPWVITGTGRLTKTGAGTLQLDRANTYTGGTVVESGTLSFFNTGSVTGDLLIKSAGTVNLFGTLGANLQGTGTVFFSGGTATLTGDNTFTGTTRITAGTLQLGVGPGGTGIAGGATGSYAGDIFLDGINASLRFNRSNDYTYAGSVTGTGSLAKRGLGKITLTGASTYTGFTSIERGTLAIAANAALGSAPASATASMIRFSNGAALETLASFTLDANRGIALNIGGGALSPAANTTLTYGGIITGTGALTKSGAGTLVLSGTNTYSGTTSVTAGRLDLDGSAANSAFTVNGGTLGGHGTIGALTIGAGGTLAPGDSPGTLSAGNTTWAGGGNYVWEINNATGVAGTNYDLLSISGSLTVNATSANPFTITLSSLTPSDLAGDVINFNSAANYTYIIASTTTGVIGFSADKFTLNTAGFRNLDPGAWSLNTAGNNLILLYAGAAAIPEPSTYAALAGLAALALAAWRRHSRRRLG